MSILIALVIAGIILIMVASVNDATISPGLATATTVLVSPLVAPANNVVVDEVVVSGQGPSSVDVSQCNTGCLLDNMCGAVESIIARADPTTNTRYYYPPDHPEYDVFRAAETQGQLKYYFCSINQAEAEGWRRAP